MYKDYLILGGAGLVGLQVCRHIVRRLEPTRIVVASLFRHEAEEAVSKLEAEFGSKVAFVPAFGNLFVPADLAQTPRSELLGKPELRAASFCVGLFSKFGEQNSAAGSAMRPERRAALATRARDARATAAARVGWGRGATSARGCMGVASVTARRRGRMIETDPRGAREVCSRSVCSRSERGGAIRRPWGFSSRGGGGGGGGLLPSSSTTGGGALALGEHRATKQPK